ncbi:hypothetical protein SDC9_74105 [bioreactor metagenome]|uniref:Uncharacterized protein n=1 Tax=bioreactor metagenome TaxID=1076179 RepID=A0A644YG58_9ZZZZ
MHALGQRANIEDVAHQQKHHPALGVERGFKRVLTGDGGDYGVDLQLFEN